VEEGLEFQEKEEKPRCKLQQVEKVEYIEFEEVVEELGGVEQETNFIIEDISTLTSDIDGLIESSSVKGSGN